MDCDLNKSYNQTILSITILISRKRDVYVRFVYLSIPWTSFGNTMTLTWPPFSLKARAYYKYKQYGFIYLYFGVIRFKKIWFILNLSIMLERFFPFLNWSETGYVQDTYPGRIRYWYVGQSSISVLQIHPMPLNFTSIFLGRAKCMFDIWMLTS